MRVQANISRMLLKNLDVRVQNEFIWLMIVFKHGDEP